MVLDQAKLMAEARFNPQQEAINRRLGLVGQQTGIRNQAVQTQGEVGRRELGGVYDTLQGLLGANRTQAMGALETAGNQIGQGYRDAAQMGEMARNQSRDALAALAQRMNAGNYAMPVIGGLEAEANRLIQGNRDRDATVTGNLRNWSAQAGSIYDQQIGTGQMMRADALSRLESDLIRAISENNLRGAEQESELNDRLAEMLGERGAYLAEQVNNLSQQEFERSFKQAQINLEREKMAQQAAQAAAELEFRANEGAADRSFRERAMAKEGQLTDKEKLQLQMQQWANDREGMQSDREYGLKVSQLRPDPLQIVSTLHGLRSKNPDTGELLPLDRGVLESFYDFGLMRRPPASRSPGFTRGFGGMRSRGGSSAPAPGGRGTLASLRATHANVNDGSW